jgi:signal transduction histidine kinase
MKRPPSPRSAFSPLRAIAASASMRLAVTVSAIFTATTLLAAAVAYLSLSQALHDRLASDARQMAENLAVTYQVSGPVELQSQIATNAATTRDFASLFLFIDNSQTIVFGNFRLNQPFIGPAELKLGRDLVLPNHETANGPATFLGYGIKVPAGWIVTARDMRWIGDTRDLMVRSVAWGLGVALALSVALAVVLARRSKIRIAALSTILTRVGKGDLTARYHEAGRRRDDIALVARSVNATLDQLAITMDSLRQVSNDVAHDLRTPLTRLRGRLDPLLAREDLPKDAIDDLQRAEAELDLILRTFNAVLRIAQIEGAQGAGAFEPTDLNDLCQSVHDMLAPVAEEAGHRFDLKLPNRTITVPGDRQMLAQAVVNLVENAIRHCPAPATITLTLTASETEAHIRICDTGPGIPEAERAQVLRRYYRLEKSRNTEGSGLGLSLVAAIIRRHNGRIELSDNHPGLCATLSLPKSQS